MELTRLFDRQDKEFGDKLFRHARFKGGGGGGQNICSSRKIKLQSTKKSNMCFIVINNK